MNTPTTIFTYPAPRSQRGLSLVELMISLTIGLLLLMGLTTLLVQQSGARDELEKSSRQIENGRYAMQILHDDIQHAGFYGEYYQLPAPPAGLPNPCDTTPAGLLAAMPLPIQGYDSPVASPLPVACLLAANYKTGTDILVIRRVSTALESWTGLNAGDVLMQTTVASNVLAAVPSPVPAPATLFPLTAKDGTTPASVRKYVVHIYFISPCSVPAGGGSTCTGSADDNGKPIPTLKRLNITAANPTSPPTIEPLVEGIENLQLDYGLDNVAPADGSPDSYTTAPATTTDWSNVMTIRVNLLARNTEPTFGGYLDTKTYNLGGTTVLPSNDNYKRHVFSELVRVINPSGRREQ